MEESAPRIAPHYDDLAEQWDYIVDSPTRSELLWPSIEAMLPDLTGRRVLDAGCGSGVYDARLVEQGAEVLGIDASESMIQEAKENVPDGKFIQADLSRPLDFLQDDSFDVVLCQHVFSHLENLTTPVEEFARILAESGVLVVSTHNPVHDYVIVRDREYPTSGEQDDLDATVEADPDAPDYVETERYDIHWNPGAVANRATYYRRSIEALISPLIDAGFELQEISEPTPDRVFKQDNPELVKELQDHPPESLCLRATH